MSPKRSLWHYLFLILLFATFAYASAGAIYADSAAAPTANVSSLTQRQLPATDLDCLPAAYSLEELVECVASYMPVAESGGFVTPTLSIRNDWRTVAQAMLSLTDSSQCDAITLPASLDGIYELFSFDDAYNGQQYCVALEIEDADDNHMVDRGWGTFIVNPTPERYLSIDIPHALDDNDTEKQGIAVFKGVAAHTFIMNGASRDANDIASPCQEGEVIADVAHCVDNFFFPTVVEIDEFHTAASNDHTAIQFHGMAAENCVNVNIYLTHGSEDAPQSTDSIVALKANLLAEQPTWSVAVPGEAGKVCEKNGTKNVEGRYLNSGDEETACGNDVDSYNGKFIHVEQHPSLATYRNPAVWIAALKNTFAPLTPPVSTESISYQSGLLPDGSYAGATDAMIRAQNSGTNYGSNAVCEAAGDGFASLARETLLRWNLTEIPAGSTIYGAEVTLNITDDTNSAGYYAYPVLRDWVEMQATWNHYSTGLGWQLAGALGALDRASVPAGRLTPADTGLYTFTLNPALVQSWLDAPSSNEGIILANAANSNRLIFDCRETATASNRPMLTVHYNDNGNTATATPEPTNTPVPTATPTPTATPAGELLYAGFSTSPTLGGVGYSDEDILTYDTATASWAIYFDGSDVGLNNSDASDVDAFYLMGDGTMLLSFDAPTTIANVGAVDDSDVIRFTPTSTGATTAGTFYWYLDGSDVLLDADSENIVGIAMTPGGNLLITTSDAGDVGFTFADEDLLEFSATSLGANSSGSWSLYFDGSDVGLSSADLRDFWVDPTTNQIYFTLLADFLPTGDKYDIFTCVPSTLGSSTTCTGGVSLYWDGSAHGVTSWRPDSLFIQR
jgi:hypothetical protein